MSFLTVASTDLRCVDTTWGEDPPETQGEEVRHADNSLGSSERTPKRGFSGDVVFPTVSDATAFRAAISVGGSLGIPTPVTATGDADGGTQGATLTVHARLGRLIARKQYGAGVVTTTWRASLKLREV